MTRKEISFRSIRPDGRQCYSFLSSRRRPLVLLLFLVFTFADGTAYTAVALSPAKEGFEIQVYTAPDETSFIVETVRDGSTLSPIAETTSGGVKWFIVKTKSGNTGWIKAGDHAQTRQVHDYFRSLPKDDLRLAPASAAASAISISGERQSRIPILLRGSSVYVVVTFNRQVRGYLLVDTGAEQTIISKRIASEFRLPAAERGIGIGVAGAFTHEVGVVDSIAVGPFEFRNFQVGVLDQSDNLQGLLGFDFLGRFHTSIDPDKKEMVLIPRKQ